MALKKLCPRCRKRIDIDQPYCDECKNKVTTNRNKIYDETVRYNKDNMAYTKFYKSIEWLKLREYILEIYNYIDLYEYYINNKLVTADTVHHIVEIRDNWSKRLISANMFPCSTNSHNVVHSMYDKNKVGTQILLNSLINKYKEEFRM